MKSARHLTLHPLPDPASDGALVTRALEGDQAAFGVLVERHQDALFRYALGMLGDSDTAADMVQDTLVRAFTRLDSCRDPERLDAWLFQILRNRCRDHLKGPWWRRATPLDSQPLLPAGGADPLSGLEQEQSLRQVRRALQALPEAQREAFLLKHLHDLSYEEMSQRLDCGVSALKMRVMRAREALLALLGDEGAG
jgi:RNA polymerase sigma-70 factor (ECF subfamily)